MDFNGLKQFKKLQENFRNYNGFLGGFSVLNGFWDILRVFYVGFKGFLGLYGIERDFKGIQWFLWDSRGFLWIFVDFKGL